MCCLVYHGVSGADVSSTAVFSFHEVLFISSYICLLVVAVVVLVSILCCCIVVCLCVVWLLGIPCFFCFENPFFARVSVDAVQHPVRLPVFHEVRRTGGPGGMGVELRDVVFSMSN